MPPPLILSACSPWRLGKLYMCFLLFSGASVPLAAAFNHGRLFVPTRSTTTAQSLTNIVGGVSPLHDMQTSPMRRVGRLSMIAANSDEPSNKSKSKTSAIAAVALGLLAFTSRTAVANAAKKVAVTAAAAAPGAVAPLVLPTIPKLALVCLLPTLLGYYKSEYGVSYGYGTAMAASSYLILSSIANAAGLPLLPAIKESISFASFQPAGILTSLCTTLKNLRSLLPASLPAFHAFALFFYGTRLDSFLLYREVFLVRFRAMRERIEDRAKKQGSRWKRTPFLISCAFLYFCMISPLLITSQLCGGIAMTCGPGLGLGGGLVSILEQSLRLSVVVALLGFLLGAFGDLNKTIGKALQGEDELITGGIFRFFRHPNYTGEVIGWTSSCIAGFLAVTLKTVTSHGSGGGSLALWKSMAPYLLLSVMGAAGISFVLATATTGLEFRQKEKYGDTDEYQEWIKKSWVGFKMDTAKKDKSSDEGEYNSESDKQVES
mmetsp:Transcript_15236/g.27673  ORF Transcript_15236/g.27673 Transcript_15236/m.27673 type:complete len:490 (+) Transcript_15236:54-1523(+)|eukprot:CAMPEP_0202025932 /NCGR_PEP_ID=MMETSP0905-20130828/57632_1 /ASSEMBLY_ACC=CAM_ASM_000554 /TAXON_ID=420261 /ORGANISM="Thalassiosira antarctica, Strain CCMP982" /LENGTH=489 /DNA_ID=CAMNT_0048588995 /DNA_START=53 /DNA_END=1522 /DNA_ORIENTATION=-